MLPILLIPGLNANARVYRDVIEPLWQFGPVQVANHLEGDGLAGIARGILDAAPPRFALGGYSFGGYLAFEILRQARERVAKLALIDTTARPDSPEATELRRRRIAQARAGKFTLAVEQAFALSAHPNRVADEGLKATHRAMALSNGPEVYVRHQEAIISRPDSRPDLGAIAVRTTIIVGEGDRTTPVEVAREMHACIRGSRLAVVPYAGHLALLEQPDAVRDALVGWASE